MMPSPTELKYFLEISSTSNISRASERLGITQPSLSLAIKRLEHELGTPLLLRSKTGVSLTRAGQQFSTKARHLLDQWQDVLESVKREESELRGSYRIGAHPAVACGRFAKVLPGILRQYPHLELKMHHDLSRRITEQVISFELDFALVVNPAMHPDLVIRRLHDDRVNFFCATDFDLDDPHRLLCFDPDLSQAHWLIKKAKAAGITFARQLHSNALDFIGSLVAAGAGIGILPEKVAQGKSTIKVAAFDVPSFIDTHALIYRADAQSSQASKQLARVIEQAMHD